MEPTIFNNNRKIQKINCWIPAAIAGAAAIGGSLLSMYSARDANKAASAASEWEYNAYRRRYQDTMADMRAAGLNPVLAASGGFNVGSQVSAPRVHQMQVPDFQSFGSNAKSIAEIPKIDEEIELLEKKVETETQTALEKAMQVRKGNKEIENLGVEYWIKRQEFNKVTQEAYKIQKEKELTEQQINKVKAGITALKYTLEKMRKSNVIDKSLMGWWLTYIEKVTNALGISTSLAIVPGIKGFGGK